MRPTRRERRPMTAGENITSSNQKSKVRGNLPRRIPDDHNRLHLDVKVTRTIGSLIGEQVSRGLNSKDFPRTLESRSKAASGQRRIPLLLCRSVYNRSYSTFKQDRTGKVRARRKLFGHGVKRQHSGQNRPHHQEHDHLRRRVVLVINGSRDI